MKRYLRISIFAILACAILAGSAAADKTIPVNDNTGVFDQPSVVMSGTTARTVYIGADNAAGPFKVFYAAVNGAANFGGPTFTRDNTVILAGPVLVDNTAPGNDQYVDARHPRIAMRTGTNEAIVLFQALPAGSVDGTHKIFLARLTLAGENVTAISVRQVREETPGPLTTGHNEDVSFGIVTKDNTARLAVANRAAAAPGTSQVRFARVFLDNAVVAGTTPVSTVPGSDGLRPIPSLKVDAAAQSHVAWAAGDSSPANLRTVYYGLVQDPGDNVAIGASDVLGGLAKRWSHPNLLITGNGLITVLAADESNPALAGNLGLSQFNPNAVTKNGLPAQYATPTTFFSILPQILDSKFDLSRPEAILDINGNIHLSGCADNALATYYVITPGGATSSSPGFVVGRTPVGIDNACFSISGDYTKAAIGRLNGKAVIFWSGLVTGTSNEPRNLDVSTVLSVTDPLPPTEESGCSMVRRPHEGESGRIPGAAILFLPAVVFAVRRRFRSWPPLSAALRRLRRRAVAG